MASSNLPSSYSSSSTESFVGSGDSPPMVVYPHSIKTGMSSQSRGSFGPVFVALAVVTILAAIACFFGRIISRRYFSPKFRREHAGVTAMFKGGRDLEGAAGFDMDISPPKKPQVMDASKREPEGMDHKIARPTSMPKIEIER